MSLIHFDRITMPLTPPKLWQLPKGRFSPMITEGSDPLDMHFAWIENRRPPLEGTCLFHPFLAKSVFQFPIIEALQIRSRLRLFCGGEGADVMPSVPIARLHRLCSRAMRAADSERGQSSIIAASSQTPSGDGAGDSGEFTGLVNYAAGVPSIQSCGALGRHVAHPPTSAFASAASGVLR